MASHIVINSDRAFDALLSDINSAWSPNKNHTSAPETVDDGGSLPITFIDLQSIGASETGGMDRSRYEFAITAYFPKPTSSTLREAKEAKANALWAYFPRSGNYHGMNWFPGEPHTVFGDEPVEAQEGSYSVQINIALDY